jgi:hypothetical protein
MMTSRNSDETRVVQVRNDKAIIDSQHRGWVGSIIWPCSPLLLLITAATTALGLASPLAGAASPPEVLTVANYAVATAIHDRPAHVVTADDVSNALATFYQLNNQLTLGYNLGNLLGVPRQISLYDSSRYAFTCVNFPNSIGGAPKIVPCSSKAEAAWQSLPFVLNASRRAVAAAASHAKAVAGADVVNAVGSGSTTSLAPKPNFLAGHGGKVRFMTKLTMGTTTRVFICVKFPKTAYGIPLQVAC